MGWWLVIDMSKLTDWMHDDITWCMDSDCPHRGCYRNQIHMRDPTGIHSYAMFHGTDLCPLTPAKVIFLDVDGVLNDMNSKSRVSPMIVGIDKAHVRLLKYIVDQTGAGIVLTELIASFKGAGGYSKLVDGMVLGPFAKAIPDAKTPQDWLSVNQENVRRYIEDPLCGARFTLGSYNALFHLIRMMDSPELYEDVWKELPILMISGKDDPCTGGEKGREDSENRLRRAGFRELEIVTLEGMRHEILNESGRKEVFRRILAFMNKE